MTRSDLTFAIPFHRGIDYLRIAIESVLAQSRGDWKLLVSDDGLDGGAQELLESYSDDRMRYRRNRATQGMVGNWNHCLDHSDTDLVTLLHADDRLLPEYAELMLGLAERHAEAAAFFCGARIIDAQGRSRFSLADAVKRVFAPSGPGPMRLEGEGALRAIMAGNFIMCPTLCYRRSVIGERRFSSDWQQVQDLEFTTRLLLEDEQLIGSRQLAYAYRRHGGAATQRQSESLLRFDEEFRLFEAVAQRAEARGWSRAARVARRTTIVKLHLGYRVLAELALLRPKLAAAKLRFLLQHR